MLRLIVKTDKAWLTCDFENETLETAMAQATSIFCAGIEVIKPRLISIDAPGTKAVREATGLGLKDSKAFVESAPVDLPKIEVTPLLKLINDLRDAGAVVEG